MLGCSLCTQKGVGSGHEISPGGTFPGWLIIHLGAQASPPDNSRILGGENFSESWLGCSVLALIFQMPLGLEHEIMKAKNGLAV